MSSIFTIQTDSDLERGGELLQTSFTMLRIVPNHGLNANLLLDFLQANSHFKFVFSFPIHFRTSEIFYSPSEVYEFIRLCRSHGISVESYREDPATNLTIDRGYFSDTNAKILFSRRLQKEARLSILVPAYNNRSRTLLALEYLNQANLGSGEYEVILCDDGSTDGLQQEVLSRTTNFNFDFTYIENPRQQTREMGDLNYRAGIARNIAARHASSKYLLFLDSDTLLPRDTLLAIQNELLCADLVTCKRIHLDPEFAEHELKGSDFSSSFSSLDNSYWTSFYEKASQWNQMPDGWKYVSSNCLAISRENFERIGGFSRNYNVYGYEDVELGYRAKQLGLKFGFCDKPVYHILPTVERSEFHFDIRKRNSLLKKSAEIFYLNTLSDEVYAHILCYQDFN